MKKITKKKLISILVVAGILIAYIHQMSPAPFLTIIRETYSINKEALLNLSVSIMYPFLIFASALGGIIESRLGLQRLFILSMTLLFAGIVLNFISNSSYVIFLVGRCLFASGMGFSIPFFGAFIMKFFNGRQREIMNTLNALFPFIGTLICFSILPLLFNAFNSRWEVALGSWSIIILFVLIVWLIGVRKDNLNTYKANDTEIDNNSNPEKRIYRNLMARRDLRLLIIIFMVDFFCYSYISVILPTLLIETASMTESVAGFWSALAFPGVGIIGCIIGGMLTVRMGKRKPLLIVGMSLEFVGIFITSLGESAGVIPILIGIAMFGLGNGLWLPTLYIIPMELKNMNPSRVGASFALLSAAGFSCGFISPAIGGWLTDIIAESSKESVTIMRHAEGLKWSLFIFGFITLIGVISAFIIKETGPCRRSYKIK